MRLVNQLHRAGGIPRLLEQVRNGSLGNLVESVRLLSDLYFIFCRMAVRGLVDSLTESVEHLLFERGGFEGLTGETATALCDGLS